jgi:uroporphyrinogen-III synthase
LISLRLLVTRPEGDGSRTAARLRALGHEVMELPLLRIEAIGHAQLGPGPWAAILFTSANAVRAIAAQRRFKNIAGLPAYVVGARTRAAADAAGFAEVISADGDADDLIALVVAQPPAADLPLLYPAGNERAGDVDAGLHAHGFRVETIEVYRSVMVADLRDDVRTALAAGRIHAVLHYSARTAAAFVAACRTAGIDIAMLATRQLCLSAQVAVPLRDAKAEAIDVAAVPTEEALLQLIGSR